MAIFTSNDASLGTKYWESPVTMNSTTDAKQGMVNDYKRVGLIHFSDLNSINWSTKIIKKITLKLKHGESGNYDGTEKNSKKTFGIYTSKYQTAKEETKGGKDVFGVQLGTFTRICSRNANVDDLILSSTDNETFFNNVVNYLKSSTTINTFCLYINDTAHISGKSYSQNYLAVTKAVISIEYEQGLMYYGTNGIWQPCLVYYGVNGKWQQVSPHYGTNNAWQQV